nr:ribonuclease H-like domain-containing protein [Tanacetum cinerariifolium]
MLTLHDQWGSGIIGYIGQPPCAATYCRLQKQGRHRESPSETRLLSETAATISNVISTLCVRKYCVSDLSSFAGSELGSELTSLAGSELQKAPSFVQPTEHVKPPRPCVKPVNHTTSAANLRKDIPKTRGIKHSLNKKACFVCKGNPQNALKDKGVIDSGCSRHMTGNISYLSNFDEINGEYVAFGGNPKGGKITSK